jgi:hypothetical protein
MWGQYFTQSALWAVAIAGDRNHRVLDRAPLPPAVAAEHAGRRAGHGDPGFVVHHHVPRQPDRQGGAAWRPNLAQRFLIAAASGLIAGESLA